MLYHVKSESECSAIAAIRLRMRMRILTRPENSLANFRREISNKKLRIWRCEFFPLVNRRVVPGLSRLSKSLCVQCLCAFLLPYFLLKKKQKGSILSFAAKNPHCKDLALNIWRGSSVLWRCCRHCCYYEKRKSVQRGRYPAKNFGQTLEILEETGILPRTCCADVHENSSA